MKIKIQLENGAKKPYKATDLAAGFDLHAIVAGSKSHFPNGDGIYAENTERMVIKPNQHALVRTGIKIELPPNYEAQIRPRSGLALKKGITVLNTPGTIDSDFRGEIGVILINHGYEKVTIENGERIAQMVIQEVPQVELEVVGELSDTERGSGGFGHTGS